MKPLLAALLVWLPAQAPAQVAEPDDYRMDHYRGPVPATLAGATVVGPEEAHSLWEDGGTAFIDVLPQAPKPANLPPGTIWRDKPRLSIPGATWLPNVGYGAIAEVTATYFRDGLAEATRERANSLDGTAIGDLYRNLADFQLVSSREEEHVETLAAKVAPAPVVRDPFLRSDVHDLDGLRQIEAHLH